LPSPDIVVPNVAGAGLASRIVAAEGGPAANPASSAAGYGQFLRGTWLEIFTRAYPQLAQKLSADQILALREVRPLALELTSRYAQQNAFSLQRVGLPATEASLSLAHAVGAGGAINILVSRPDQPVENLLGREAVEANPFLKQMTASAVQQWATNRIRPLARLPELAGPARRLEDIIEPLRPEEDFRVDGQLMASQVLAQNRILIAALRNLLEASSFKTGAGSGAQLGPSTADWLSSVGVDPAELLAADPNAVRIFDKSATKLVLETIHGLTIRTAYREFKAIENSARARDALRPAIIRDVASALVEKIRRENATITTIVRHRRSADRGRPTADGHLGRRGT
jgi:hypothetical protein